MRSRKAIIGALLVGAFFISACGSSGSGGSGSGESSGGRSGTDEGIKDGGTLFILDHSTGATNLDPQRIYTGADLGFLGSTITRTLTSYTPVAGKAGTQLLADLATDTGTPSDDVKTWSFTLRDGVTFEDGAAIVCADIRYGVSRTFASDMTGDEGPLYATTMLAIEGEYPGPYTATADQQAAYEKAVECSEDGKTITFHLKNPVADFNYTVALLAFAPVPKAADTADKYTLKPVSSGPFMIKSYEEGKELIMVRNPNWSADSDPIRKPHVDEIHWQFGLDESVIDERMIADAGDDQATIVYGGLQPENLQTVFDNETYADRRTDGFDGFVSYTMINIKKVPCLEVRQAFWLALDREALRTAGGGPFTGEFADSFINPLLATDYTPGTVTEGLNADGTPNVEAAQAKMDAAKESCPEVHKHATEDGLRFDHGQSELWAKLISIWIDSLGAVGIKIIDNAIEPSKYYATINKDPGDLMRAGWAADWNNASTVVPELFTKEGGFNYSQNWEDPAYPAFSDKVNLAKAEVDRAKQATLWQELNQYVLDQAWAVPGSFTKAQNLVGSRVRNAYPWLPFGWYNVGAIGLAE